MPLCAADWCAVTTVEGIGSSGKGLHPVQERLTVLHGSQCGFCTPGIIMAMYTLFRNTPNLNSAEMREHMDGNLCRCTGYRPILDAGMSLCADGGCCEDGGGCGGCSGCPDVECNKGECKGEPTGKLVDGDIVTDTKDKLAHYDKPYHSSTAASSEPEFPTELTTPPTPLRMQPNGEGGPTWWRPTTLDELLSLKEAEPGARIVVGASEIAIESRYKNHPAVSFLNAAAVPELKACEDTPEELIFGACAPLSDVEHLCKEAAASRPGHAGEAARAISDMLRWFASTQIRNVACLGGNLVTASPISDMIPMLVACNAILTIQSKSGGTRTAPVSSFILGYRKVDLKPNELLVSVRVPHTKANEFLRPFKQARRREDDISIVTGGLFVRLEPSNDKWSVAEARFAFGGLAPTVVLATKTADALVGKEWCAATIEGSCKEVMDELRVGQSAPGGQPEYRTALAASALFKFFVSTSVSLSEGAAATGAAAAAAASLPPPPVIAAADASAAQSWISAPKPASSGTQRYPHASYPGLEADPDKRNRIIHGIVEGSVEESEKTLAEKAGGVKVVGESRPHAAAHIQTTGEAEYADDAPTPPGTLNAWLVRAERAPATLVSVDASDAKSSNGVVSVFFASDLPEGAHNSIGPIMKDELCFAEDHVLHVGQVIGIVVAETAELARIAATKVKVTYGPPPEGIVPCYTIADSVANNSFFDTGPFSTKHDLESGPDIDAALAAEGLTKVTGEFKMGGQEHFYLECQNTLVQPTDDGGLYILASTQAVDKTQKLCSRVCNIPCNKVVSKVKRMGGGFGGKETRSVFASCAVAVAAHLLKKPVRLSLRRDVDMGTSGGRHPFVAKYTAAAKIDETTGKPMLAALDVQLYSNGGAMLDLSGPVMDRALLHIDNCYKWPSFRAHGVVCKTHTPPNTAFRGFGGPQGMIVTEHIMYHLAMEMKVSVDDLRDANLYPAGALTPFGQVLEDSEWRIPKAMSELKVDADIESRKQAIETFNAENKWRKRGIALMPTKYGINFTAKFMNQGGALVHLYTDGTVLITHGGTEMGQGLHTKVCQVAARAFGIPLSACHITETATDKIANSMPTAASASTDLYAMATLDACRQILARLAPLRASKPNASLAEIALIANFERIDLSAHGFFAIANHRCGFDWNIRPGTSADGTPDQTTRGHPFNYFTQGVGCVEVEIDVLTGDHEVKRADVLVDLGSSINPALDVGQIEGAFTQGMGWTTTEELMWGDDDHKWVQPPGRLHTSGPGTYKLPSFNDTPRQLNVRLMSGVDNKVAVHSSKAVGEPPFFLGAATFFAIRDAIAAARKEHATGDYFNLLSPATTERIRMACGDEIAKSAGAPADGEALLCRGSF